MRDAIVIHNPVDGNDCVGKEEHPRRMTDLEAAGNAIY
jgi:hypothetical protein